MLRRIRIVGAVDCGITENGLATGAFISKYGVELLLIQWRTFSAKSYSESLKAEYVLNCTIFALYLFVKGNIAEGRKKIS